MQKIILLLSLLLLPLASHAQKHDYVWTLGYDSNTVDTTWGGMNIDFNTSPPTYEYLYREMDFINNAASICDENGKLLFYTNNCYIAGPDGEMIENGDSLNPGEAHDKYCNFRYPINQSAIILPAPGESNQYYILHKDSWLSVVDPWNFDIFSHHLYCTKVDMNANNGKGQVTEKNKLIFQDTLWGADLTAVKHNNGQDWWFFCRKLDTNRIYKFLLQKDTVQGPFVQEIGEPLLHPGNGGGQAAFSPDGKTYAQYDPINELMIYNFDRENGLLSNYRTVSFVDSQFVIIGGIAFSPNSRFLYVSNAIDLYQVDLEADDLESSKVHIGHYDGFGSGGLPVNFFQGILGPDCKVYIWPANTVQHVHVIHQPDKKGHACQLEMHGIELPARHGGSPPNFPNYRLGSGPVCDSTISMVPTSVVWASEGASVKVFPNPAKSYVNVKLHTPTSGTLILSDINGKAIRSKPIDPAKKNLMLQIDGLPAGIYLVTLKTKEGNTSTKKLVITN